MLFTSFALMGLAALVSAAPRPDASNLERGLTWNPRGLEARGRGSRNSNNNDVTIVDTTFVQIDEQSRGREQELTILVQKKTVIRDNSSRLKDNIRKNHYRSKNRNVNTVIIVVTEVIDIRDSNNKNTRYLRRQIRANNNKNNSNNDVIVQITEVVAITIDNSNSNGNGKGRIAGATQGTANLVAATGVASASVPIQTIAANAPYAPSNQTELLPSGSPPPSFAGISSDLDPARIVEENQLLFVQEVSS